MTIADMIPFLRDNADKIKLHCAIGRLNKTEPLFQFSRGQFKEWQEDQNNKNFEREYILSIIYIRKGEWMFAGLYKRLTVRNRPNNKYKYETALMDTGADLIGRLRVAFLKDFRASYLLFENHVDDLDVLEVTRHRYRIDPFPGFESVCVNFDLLKEIYAEDEPTWKAALSNVKGVYLISDTATGKLYVGSAYGEDAFWSRWSNYVETGHGNNIGLKAVLETNGLAYASNFRFSILEIRKVNTEDEHIIERENYWKTLLLTREFGYNEN
ncbi:MAG: GIY-YIG nuclease family protein [Candidatus Competibacteraceae bacterium]|nr:GIY-YIG nuclease family protein [Candidatus Competibacteraceae bacterium]